jgi:RNA 3'-terminal phosphate cyclase (ATP)/RNA 3'-terminal phosphate cyclase (GTP)
MIDIDGSEGEGGGQMLRTATALSVLTGKAVRVHDIRANRPKPGLAAQHLCAVSGVANLCEAQVEGLEVGSTQITFAPGKVRPGKYRLDVGTAGSVTLVLQACLLASARCQEEIRFEIAGGTNVRWSPPIDFYQRLFFPKLADLGFQAQIIEMRRGFYPEGGGLVEVRFQAPREVAPMHLSEKGKLLGAEGVCFSQNLPEHVCQRIAHAVRKEMLGDDIVLTPTRTSGASTGAGAFLMARYDNAVLGADSLGERGVPAEQVGSLAAKALRQEMDGLGTLDVHAADQLLPYLALADGPSSFRVRQMTGHLRTQIELVRRFLDVRVESVEAGATVEVDVNPNCT